MVRSTTHAPRRPNLQKLVRMVTESGLLVVRTEIFPDGRIVLFHVDEHTSSAATNPFDEWKARRDAR